MLDFLRQWIMGDYSLFYHSVIYFVVVSDQSIYKTIYSTTFKDKSTLYSLMFLL